MVGSVRLRRVFAAAALAFAAGCQSYDIVQANIFSDDDGNIVRVEYGRGEKHHVNTFVSPVTGEEMEFKSKLMVRVQLPDGRSFRAWQCMNFLSSGTMYKTDDGEWMFLASGFTCAVFANAGGDGGDYLEVYRGVLCESPRVDAPKNDKWKTLPRTQGTRWKK
jgi:hypothetical protein